MSIHLNFICRLRALRFAATTVLILAVAATCHRQPVWVTEVGNLMDRGNQELEGAMPFLGRNASTQELMIGLNRLEKAIDYGSTETLRLMSKYPEINRDSRLAESLLRPKFEKLGKNIVQATEMVNYWEKKLQGHAEFEEIFQRLKKKTRNANDRTVQPF